jgi:hypothetical protein
MSARWEMDLSPGTRALPASGPADPETTGCKTTALLGPMARDAGFPMTSSAVAGPGTPIRRHNYLLTGPADHGNWHPDFLAPPDFGAAIAWR